MYNYEIWKKCAHNYVIACLHDASGYFDKTFLDMTPRKHEDYFLEKMDIIDKHVLCFFTSYDETLNQDHLIKIYIILSEYIKVDSITPFNGVEYWGYLEKICSNLDNKEEFIKTIERIRKRKIGQLGRFLNLVS